MGRFKLKATSVPKHVRVVHTTEPTRLCNTNINNVGCRCARKCVYLWTHVVQHYVSSFRCAILPSCVGPHLRSLFVHVKSACLDSLELNVSLNLVVQRLSSLLVARVRLFFFYWLLLVRRNSLRLEYFGGLLLNFIVRHNPFIMIDLLFLTHICVLILEIKLSCLVLVLQSKVSRSKSFLIHRPVCPLDPATEHARLLSFCGDVWSPLRFLHFH